MKLFFSDYTNEPQGDILVMIGESADDCTDLCSFKKYEFEETAWRLQMFDDCWKWLADDCVVDLLTEITEGINPIESLKTIGAEEIKIKYPQSTNHD